jgi:hypothetical protein
VWELSCADAVLAHELAPTPSCYDGDEPTARQKEGPFFKPRSPERSDLRERGAGCLKGSARLLALYIFDRAHQQFGQA